MSVKRNIGIFLATAALAACMLPAFAAPKRVGVAGRVKSFADDKSHFVIARSEKGHKGEEVKVMLAPATPFYLYARGAEADLKDGVPIKVYGKVSEDLSTISDVYHMCVMPKRSNYSNKKTRVDGLLIVKDGKPTGIDNKGKTIALQAKPKFIVEVVTDSSFDEMAVGRNVRMSGVVTDGVVTNVPEVRYYGAK